MKKFENWDRKKTARIAGLLYLIVVITGFFSIAYVPMRIMVQGDSAATVSNLVTNKTIFEFSIVAGVICYTAFLVLPLVLYKLLSQINKWAATLMVVFAVVSVPISLLNLHHKLDVLSFLSGEDYLKALPTEQLQVQIMMSLEAYSNGILISTIFWGLWLFPFGYLVFESGFLPRVLGILLMIGCFGYLIHFYGDAFIAGYSENIAASLISLPAALGEIGTCFWLLIVGVYKPKEAIASASNAA